MLLQMVCQTERRRKMVVVCDCPEMTLLVEGIMLWVTGVACEDAHFRWLQQVEGLPLPAAHHRSQVCSRDIDQSSR